MKDKTTDGWARMVVIPFVVGLGAVLLLVAASQIEAADQWLTGYASAVASIIVGSAVVSVTWIYTAHTRTMASEMQAEREERATERSDRRHGTLASLLAETSAWQASITANEGGCRPFSLTLYDDASHYLWLLWDEIRPEFVRLGSQVRLINSPTWEGHGMDDLLRTLEILNPMLRAYLSEHVVRCEERHEFRLTYEDTEQGVPAELPPCPRCKRPLAGMPLGYSTSVPRSQVARLGLT